jgi:hypothetical protein
MMWDITGERKPRSPVERASNRAAVAKRERVKEAIRYFL